MIGTTRSAGKKAWIISTLVVITSVIYHPVSLISTTSSVQFAFGFSHEQQKQYSSISLFQNRDRTLHSIVEAHRSSVNVKRSDVISPMIPDLQQTEPCQRRDLKIDPKKAYYRLRRWYTQKLGPVLRNARKLILSLQCYVWFVALFLSWNIALPSAIATTQTTTMTTRMSRSIRPARTNSVKDDTSISHDTSFMIGTPSHEGNSFHGHSSGHKGNQRKIRFMTTSAVILATSAIGVNKVNRREQTNDKSIDSEHDQADIMDDQDISTASATELTWLLPKNDGSDNEAPDGAASVSSSSSTAKPSSTPILSQRTNDITNVVERLKQVSLPTKAETSWFAKSVVKSESSPKPQLLQQPKSLQEELQLQAKYASIESLEERAYTILVDLGMVEEPTIQDPFDSAWE